jgi:hypothetical protein
MKAKEFIPASKPRNFVVKNQKTAGAGAHKDKKRAEKQGDVKHKKQTVPMESSLNELAGYGSDKKYKNLGSYKRYDVYVGKQKFNNLYYIAVAENPRTLDAKFKAKGNSAEEALNKLKDEIDKEIDVATKVSGQATLDFNVDFVKDILEMSSSVFYAKIVSGPKLVIAGPEMMGYPEIMRDEGFKASAIRTYKGGEGTTKLPGVPLSAKAASSANLIANGRYVLGSETIDKDGNRVFNLEFDSVVQASNDKMRLRAPAVTIGTNRSQGVAEVSKATIDQYVAKASDAHGDADFKARMSKNDPDKRSYHIDQKKTAEKRRQGISRALDRMSKNEEAAGVGIVTKQNATADVPAGGEYMNVKKFFPKKKKVKEQSVAERVRDPEDWDEGNTEPPNNFAVYINGKKWKVFKGRGQFADDYKEIQHYRQLQNWAQEKSQATGKKWEVHRTGEAPTA